MWVFFLLTDKYINYTTFVGNQGGRFVVSVKSINIRPRKNADEINASNKNGWGVL